LVQTNEKRPARISPRCGAPLCVWRCSRLVLAVGGFDDGLRLDGAEHARGDREHDVHERELHLMVPFAAFGCEG